MCLILSCARPWMRDNCRRCCPAVASRMGISPSCGPPAATCHREYAVLSILWLRQRYPCHPHRRPLPSEKPCAGYPAARPAKAGGRCAPSIIRQYNASYNPVLLRIKEVKPDRDGGAKAEAGQHDPRNGMIKGGAGGSARGKRHIFE